jgi:4-hydroxyproline epimerase
MSRIQRVSVIDSHTGGEPTRVVVSGGPDLGGGGAAAQLARFRTGHDRFRSAVVNEPRGSGALVGALLTAPSAPGCVSGVLFFNNVGTIGMCGHGAIGVGVTLARLGRIGPGEHRIETPVGVVAIRLHPTGGVSVRNVPSFRLAAGVRVRVPGHGVVTGDVAWGGNWFFLCEDHGQELVLASAASLTEFAWRIRRALEQAGITGGDGRPIDHVELIGPPARPDADARNFVLCPGGAYDRSACGTGTSAKLACLVADGKLQPGETWRQESITGSLFEARAELVDGELVPTITGTAFVTAEATLILDPADPCCWGIG